MGQTVQGIVPAAAGWPRDAEMVPGSRPDVGRLLVSGGGGFAVSPLDGVQTTLVSGPIALVGPTALIAAPAAGFRIVVVAFMMQNESAVATTLQLGYGGVYFYRCLGQNQGDGVLQTYPPGREWRLPAATALALLLSGANACGYSVAYFVEAV